MDYEGTKTGAQYGAGIGGGLGAIQGVMNADMMAKAGMGGEALAKLIARNPKLAALALATGGGIGGGLGGALQGGAMGGLGGFLYDSLKGNGK